MCYSYHCLFCDGYEDRGVESAGVLAIGDLAKLAAALNVARMAKRLTSRVVIYVDGNEELSKWIGTALGDDSVITIDERHITRIEKVSEETSDVILHFSDGSKVSHGFIVSSICNALTWKYANKSRLTNLSPKSMDHSWSN